MKILILIYNSLEHLNVLLPSLLSDLTTKDHIVIIDNGSDQQFPINKYIVNGKIEYVRFEVNLGYAQAHNLILKTIFDSEIEDLVLILNPDTYIPKGTLKKLKSEYYKLKSQHKSQLGLVQPTITLLRDLKIINTAGNSLYWNGLSFSKDIYKSYNIYGNKPREISFVSGCAMLISRDFFTNVGGFDMSYFLYYEDTEISARGLMKGYKNFTIPSVIVGHNYSLKGSAKKILYAEKNRLRFILEYYPVIGLLILSVPILIIEILVNLFLIIKYNNFDKLTSYRMIILESDKIFKKREQSSELNKWAFFFRHVEFGFGYPKYIFKILTTKI